MTNNYFCTCFSEYKTLIISVIYNYFTFGKYYTNILFSENKNRNYHMGEMT